MNKPHPNPKLNNLSMKERENGIHDLHGVADIPQENGALVRSTLEQLRKQLSLNDSVAIDDSELIKFLRAENFDTPKACGRLNRFSTFQTKLFGKHGRMRVSELDEEDSKILQSGSMQLLPERDNAGRAIIMCLGAMKQQLKTSLESDLRCLSLLVSKAAKDEETQKRGVVVVYYALAQRAYDGRNNRPVQLLKAFESLPARVVATHFCYDNSAMKPLLNLLSNHMETKMLCRFRSHYGQHAECQYSLMSFGIPKECLPIDAFGQVDLTNHQMLLKRIKLEEEQHPPGTTDSGHNPVAEGKIKAEKFLIPGYLDIILGRGQHAKNTPGHQRFKQLIEAQQPRYEAAEKSLKTVVADAILKELKEAGCRFLKPRPQGGWVQVNDDAGREKINHAFRNLRNNSRRAAAAAASTTQSCSRKRAFEDDLDSEMYRPFKLTADFSASDFFPL
ncbi:unnamed protein product [Cylindrotheca closterium]|uniref:CRAL/TRIO N-terminal domain-containing protein n=1 Tax=Cylindrotheca closterium TaxID=2856 RepID=A0AAD2JG98_9STRA|nr:unnamed protein product [Cylindrotheca closterium]